MIADYACVAAKLPESHAKRDVFDGSGWLVARTSAMIGDAALDTRREN